ncbi:helix-turn-helix domain-containing protein [Mycobacteroides chelonae]|uniref:helix-turn-helix domain-containing protein n=1 Tax=Mycobacteroides chelonae TaxID=1774 RepID=UPI001910842F|nr:helix-turn-helix domain-containing protein [Mycobacteroides chelonae]
MPSTVRYQPVIDVQFELQTELHSKLLQYPVQLWDPPLIKAVLEAIDRYGVASGTPGDTAGDYVRAARGRAQMSQRQLASLIGYSVGWIQHIERGRRRVPVDALPILVSALGLNPLEADYLWSLTSRAACLDRDRLHVQMSTRNRIGDEELAGEARLPT